MSKNVSIDVDAGGNFEQLQSVWRQLKDATLGDVKYGLAAFEGIVAEEVRCSTSATNSADVSLASDDKATVLDLHGKRARRKRTDKHHGLGAFG